MRNRDELDWSYIEDQLDPLVEVKQEPEILDTLAPAFASFSQDLLRNRHPPMRQYVWMVKYGYYYAGALLAGGALLTYLAGWPYGVPFYILAVFCLNFFRDPERHAPPGPVAVSPADGKVVAVVPGAGGASRVSIFLNVFDVHVNRSPIAGKIACINYKKGEFPGGQQGSREPGERTEHPHRGRRRRRMPDAGDVQTDRRPDRAPHHLLQDAWATSSSR